jgi:zinc transport system ATP-binding protein
MNGPVIQIHNLAFSYDGEPVLKDICLDVLQGEFLGIIGPNAGGKSTLLKLIMGLLEPQRGSVLVFGKPPSNVSARIGYIPQHALFPHDFPISVEETVLLGRLGQTRPFLGYNRRDKAVARQAMEAVEIGPLRKKLLSELSGGQLQRVLIARALACEPEILLLDEPTANIDVRVEEDIFALLKQYNEKMTILVVSHDVAFISSYVTRVACLNRTLVCHDTADLTGQIIDELYGTHVRLIQHAHGTA